MGHLPNNLHPLFWDIKVETFDPVKYPEYTISRVLEFGDRNAVIWMKNIFSESQIIGVIKSDRKLSPKSANFWGLVYGIPSNKVAALKKRDEKDELL